jgi:hypothetical protein
MRNEAASGRLTRALAGVKALGYFYLVFGAGFFAGCAFVGFAGGAGFIHFK